MGTIPRPSAVQLQEEPHGAELRVGRFEAEFAGGVSATDELVGFVAEVDERASYSAAA
jgi:hypothetical protein